MAFDSWDNERAMTLASAALKIVDAAAEPLRATGSGARGSTG